VDFRDAVGDEVEDLDLVARPAPVLGHHQHPSNFKGIRLGNALAPARITAIVEIRASAPTSVM
jgi:hypothetical protein